MAQITTPIVAPIWPQTADGKTLFNQKSDALAPQLINIQNAMNAYASEANALRNEVNGFQVTASAAAVAAANAQTAAEVFRDEAEEFRDQTAAIAASIPDGTINDTITTTTDTWSSSKISSEIASAGAVDSVNGQTGVVVLTKTDVGLGNVDNTADADKLINASNLNTGTVPSARLPNATSTEAGALKARLNGTEAFFTFNGVDA